MTVCFIHCALVALLNVDLFGIIPHRTTHVACLLLRLASNDIQNKSIAWHFLVIFNFDDIADLDTCPVTPLEALVSSLNYKFLNRLTVDDISCFSKSFVFPKIEDTRNEQTAADHNNAMTIILYITRA